MFAQRKKFTRRAATGFLLFASWTTNVGEAQLWNSEAIFSARQQTPGQQAPRQQTPGQQAAATPYGNPPGALAPVQNGRYPAAGISPQQAAQPHFMPPSASAASAPGLPPNPGQSPNAVAHGNRGPSGHPAGAPRGPLPAAVHPQQPHATTQLPAAQRPDPRNAPPQNSAPAQPAAPNTAGPVAARQNVDAVLAHAKSLEEQGAFQQAEAQYQRGLQQFPDNRLILLSYARMLHRNKELDRAIGVYRHALQVYRQDPVAMNDLGLCLARQGDLQGSITTLSAAVASRPDSKRYRNNLATVLIEAGRMEEAYVQLAQVHGAPQAYYNLGYLLHRRGRTAEAIHHLQLALKLDPQNQTARSLLASIDGADTAPYVADRRAAADPAATSRTPQRAPHANTAPAPTGPLPTSSGQNPAAQSAPAPNAAPNTTSYQERAIRLQSVTANEMEPGEAAFADYQADPQEETPAAETPTAETPAAETPVQTVAGMRRLAALPDPTVTSASVGTDNVESSATAAASHDPQAEWAEIIASYVAEAVEEKLAAQQSAEPQLDVTRLAQQVADLAADKTADRLARQQTQESREVALSAAASDQLAQSISAAVSRNVAQQLAAEQAQTELAAEGAKAAQEAMVQRVAETVTRDVTAAIESARPDEEVAQRNAQVLSEHVSQSVTASVGKLLAEWRPETDEAATDALACQLSDTVAKQVVAALSTTVADQATLQETQQALAEYVADTVAEQVAVALAAVRPTAAEQDAMADALAERVVIRLADQVAATVAQRMVAQQAAERAMAERAMAAPSSVPHMARPVAHHQVENDTAIRPIPAVQSRPTAPEPAPLTIVGGKASGPFGYTRPYSFYQRTSAQAAENSGIFER